MARVRDRITQRIRESDILRLIVPNWANDLIVDYISKAQDIDELAEEIDSLQPLTGSGNPNTIVISPTITGIAANRSKIYYNTSTNPPQQWFNNTLGNRTGWVML